MRGAIRVAIDPLLSQATSRAGESQRGTGDEKRRQDLAADFISRIVGPGRETVASGKTGREDLSRIGGRESRAARSQTRPEEAGQRAEGDDAGPAFGGSSQGLPGNGLRFQVAAIGFSAQLFSESLAVQDNNAPQGGTQQAVEAYSSTQSRATPSMPGSGPQVVTESGMMMGFGAVDARSRFDVTV